MCNVGQYELHPGVCNVDHIVTQVEVLEVALDQCGPATERKLTIIDKNRDLFLTSVRIFGTERKSTKLGEWASVGGWVCW